MQTYEVNLKSKIFNNYRCKRACDSLDIDIKKKSEHNFKIECDLKTDFNIGLIYGNSGSGKTTLAKKIYGDNIFEIKLNENDCIMNQLNENLTYEECAQMLNGIGLNSVPCWVKPINTLSNGQKARAEAVFLMQKSNDIILIDEWTSVVDRTIAKVMSLCLNKFAKKNNKKIIVLSCHADIIEWLNPDWIIDCNKQEFIKHSENNVFFSPNVKKSNLKLKKSGKNHGDILASIII
jgi:ABC-type lipoprotein export system ATPase subunit